MVENTLRLQKTPADFRKYLATAENIRRLQKTPDDCGKHLTTAENTRRLQKTPDDCRKHLTTAENAWRLQKTTTNDDCRNHPTTVENTRRLQKTPDDCRKYPTTAENSRRLQKTTTDECWNKNDDRKKQGSVDLKYKKKVHRVSCVIVFHKIFYICMFHMSNILTYCLRSQNYNIDKRQNYCSERWTDWLTAGT